MEKLWREFPRIHFHSCPFVKFGSKIKSVSICAHPWLNCAVLLGNGKSRTGFPERLGCRSSIFGHSVFRSEEHTSELQSPCNLLFRLLLATSLRRATGRVGLPSRRWPCRQRARCSLR